MSFIHLHLHTPFSFLDGASRVEDLVRAAARFDMPALAMTDHNNVSAAPRFHRACQQAGLQPIIGAEVTLEGGHHLTLLAQNPRGYGNLCRIITEAHLSKPRLQPAAPLEALREHSGHIIALCGCRRGQVPSLILARRYAEAEQAALALRDILGPERFFLEIQNLLLPGTRALNARMAELAEHIGVGLVATNNVHHLRREDFPVHDVLTCARTLTRLDDVHPERRLNAQGYMRSPDEMRAFIREYPQALEATLRIAKMCEPAIRPGEYHLPAYPAPEGVTARQMLRRLTWQGAKRRYGRIAPRIRQRLEHELSVIEHLGFEDYFLIVWDLLRFADSKGIRHAGRGSAADSAVAYCLGITGVDAIARGLLFERFMSLERAAMPDIDVDFEAGRRDDVMRYVLDKYGQEHVAVVATYNTFHARSAVRDLGKAMGLPLAEVDRLARRLPYFTPADTIGEAFEKVPELRDSHLPKGHYERLIEICQAVAGFPRHLSTHLGGIVITREPLLDVSPLQMAAKNVRVIQFDKDDVEDLGLVKLDLLCLRMLSAVEDTVRTVRTRDSTFDYDTIPLDDHASYELIAASDTVGVFQLESPAQRALHARLQPKHFEDIVASVALIRPGPIQANMVHPYIARRQGAEPVTYLHPSLERILGKTYGVVLFQEQVIEIATEIAGFTPGEADRLRRAMTHHRSREEMERIGEFFIERAKDRGVEESIAREIFSYIQAYAGYGFCEAHASAFGDTAYKTAYLKAHHPTEFYAALLSHQPMGFYPPNTLIWEAKRRGIGVLGPDVNRSEPKFTVEDGAIRVSLSQIRGIGEGVIARIVAERERGGPFRSLRDFCERVSADRDVVRDMILCGAFDSICGNRRQLIWELDAICQATTYHGPSERQHWDGHTGPSLQLRYETPQDDVPDFPPRERWAYEFDILGLAVSKHPLEWLREDLRRKGVITVAEAKRAPRGQRVKVAGLIIRPHRPPTRSGRTVVFFTLEDETDLLDVTVFESVYQRYGKPIFTQAVVTVTGRTEGRRDDGSVEGVTATEVE
jgi:error-prone DNA polymerase